MNFRININDVVHVRLTELGMRMHRERYDKVFADFKYPPRYIPPHVDGAGWTGFQLHELMNLFGSALHNGGELPFETEIKVGLK